MTTLTLQAAIDEKPAQAIVQTLRRMIQANTANAYGYTPQPQSAPVPSIDFDHNELPF